MNRGDVAATQRSLRDGNSAYIVDAVLAAEGGASSADGAPLREDGASSSEGVDACTTSSPSQAFGAVGPSDRRPQSRLIHFFVDVQHAEDSTYEIEERHVPINPTFHAHLQDH